MEGTIIMNRHKILSWNVSIMFIRCNLVMAIKIGRARGTRGFY